MKKWLTIRNVTRKLGKLRTKLSTRSWRKMVCNICPCNRNYILSIHKYVYDHVNIVSGLKKISFPPDETPASQSFFYASENYETAKHLLVLIHGSGVVRYKRFLSTCFCTRGFIICSEHVVASFVIQHVVKSRVLL